MAQGLKQVRVVTNTNIKAIRSVRIVTSQSGHTFPTWGQMTAAQTAANPRQFEQVQDATAAYKPGMLTVCIPGYSAPN
jgi:hypothetical protein